MPDWRPQKCPGRDYFRPLAMGKECFNGWFGTPWYAMLYNHRDDEDATAMVKPLLAKGRLKPGDEVLDMACGRGRHAAVFAREGLRVTGIDLSPARIEEARKAVPDAHFEVFDFRDPFATNRFDAVVCLFTSLGYSPDREDDRRAVRSAAQALKPDGLFVLDLLNGRYVVQHLIHKETQVIGNNRFEVERKLEGTDIVKWVRVTHAGGTEEFEERVHAWLGPEVEGLVVDAGLRVEDMTDGSCLGRFDPEHSERIVVWARKKRA